MIILTLQFCQISETVNNLAEIDSLTNRFTLSVINTFTFNIIVNECIDADNSDNLIKILKTVTAHNQKVIKYQWL